MYVCLSEYEYILDLFYILLNRILTKLWFVLSSLFGFLLQVIVGGKTLLYLDLLQTFSSFASNSEKRCGNVLPKYHWYMVNHAMTPQ